MASQIERGNGVVNTTHYAPTEKNPNGKEKDIRQIYNGSINESLYLEALIKLFGKGNIIKTSKRGNKTYEYTDALVAVEFNDYSVDSDKKYTKLVPNKHKGELEQVVLPDRVASKKKLTLRRKYYETPFTLNEITYVMDKRSSSQARQGKCLFIKKEYIEKITAWSRLNVSLKKKLDIATLRAYESLVLSGLKDKIKIGRHQILLIDDVEDTWKDRASVTSVVNNSIVEETKDDWDFVSNLWDGQSLLDESYFGGKASMLLRGRWFKTAAFNCKVKDYLKTVYGKPKIKDMFNNELNTDDIVMITTPNSLKWLKIIELSDDFADKAEAYERWLSKLEEEENVFGVVKSESRSKFGDMQQLSYQMLQSMPFTKEQLAEVFKYEHDYVKNIRNDNQAFRRHVDEQDLDEHSSLMDILFASVPEIFKTTLFRDYRQQMIQRHTRKLRKGKIKIANSDYAWLLGNPYEMLQAAIGVPKDQWWRPLKENQVYRPTFLDKVEFTLFRNPHICAGNIAVVENKFDAVFRKWFNLNPNVIVVNSMEYDIQPRLGGCDFDSDVALVASSKTILGIAKVCVEKYAVPVCDIQAKTKLIKKATAANLADIDGKIADNFIGVIINWSQVFNSYLFDTLHNKVKLEDEDKYPKTMMEGFYKTISILSSLSQVELDKPKKYFEINKITDEYLDNLRLHKHIRDEVVKYTFDIKKGTRLTDTRKTYLETLKQNGYTMKQLMDSGEEYKKLSKKIAKAEYDDEDSEIIELMKNKYNEILNIIKPLCTESLAIVRPMFFKQIQKPDFMRYDYQKFDCPMDWLQQYVLKIPPKVKKDTDTVELCDVMNKRPLNNNKRKQVDAILKLAEEYDGLLLQKSFFNEYEKDYVGIALLYEDYYERLVEKKIDMDMAYALIKWCFDEKSQGDKSRFKNQKMMILKGLCKTNKQLVKDCFLQPVTETNDDVNDETA